MSCFFFEDTVALKDDLLIIATVEHTWSEVDKMPTEGFMNCYIHDRLPSKVKKAWFEEKTLLPGYIVLEFLQPYDGFCLVAESSLQLVDRGLTIGDVVKRKPYDTQSGTILSTSLLCSLRPSCKLEDYNQPGRTSAQSYSPSYGPHGSIKKNDEMTNHGFPIPKGITTEGKYPSLSNEPWLKSPLQVPAQELTFWNEFRDEDYIIYRNWVGIVKDVHNEVTIRLQNGSVVTVEDPEELEEPYFITGSPSFNLAQRLDRAKFYVHRPLRHAPGKGQSYPTSPYPGQQIQTKKGNLRRGDWKFGAYDPSLAPIGIIVDVRCIQLEVSWIFPNLFDSRTQESPPPILLGTDALEHEKVKVFEHSRLPKHALIDQLPNASYGPDTGFGRRVRFKDPAGAAVKYGPAMSTENASKGHAQSFNRLSRAATQGYDMNVQQVISTRTKALIKWQDNSISEEDSTSLIPYLNADEHDVWPGEKVSFKPDEELVIGDNTYVSEVVRARTVGVVQSVNALERIARVRWFEAAEVNFNQIEKSLQVSPSYYGKIGDKESDVPLYDIGAYPVLENNRRDLVVVMPEFDIRHLSMSEALLTQARRLEPANNTINSLASSIELAGAPLGISPSHARMVNAYIGRARRIIGLTNNDGATVIGSTLSSHANGLVERSESTQNQCLVSSTDANGPAEDCQDIFWFGEIVDLCPDGEVIVRLCAASEARDVKLPMERVVTVAKGDPSDSSDYINTDDEDEELSDGSENDSGREVDKDDENEASPEPMEISVEYEGGKKLDADSDEEMWTTDQEDGRVSEHPILGNIKDSIPTNPEFRGETSSCDPQSWKNSADLSENDSSDTIRFSTYESMPSSFSIIEGPAPIDHHFSSTTRPLTAELLRRIAKEHVILQSSLPDGVFARTWETRMDLLRVLIVGPSDTPYEFAPFVVDLQFGQCFPASPPDAFFHSWTGSLGRVNPNLYEDGKICLSLLGTWPSDDRNEGWSGKRSTILQIIVSLMGLVLVKEPYFNEAGFEVLAGSPESRIPSALYNEKAYVMSKAFVKTALTSPPQGLADVIDWLYMSEPGPTLLSHIVSDSNSLLPTPESGFTVNGDRGVGGHGTPKKFSAGALVLLRRILDGLKPFMRPGGEVVNESKMS